MRQQKKPAEHSSLISIPNLTRVNGMVDIIRRTYNRFSQWFNIFGLSIGRYNRLIPFVGLVLNLVHLTFRGIISHYRPQPLIIDIIFKILLALLISSSIAIFVLNAPSLIVNFTLANTLLRVLLDVMDISFLIPRKSLKDIFPQTQHQLLLSGIRLFSNVSLFGLSYLLFSSLTSPAHTLTLILMIEIIEIAVISILINNLTHQTKTSENQENIEERQVIGNSTPSMLAQLGPSIKQENRPEETAVHPRLWAPEKLSDPSITQTESEAYFLH